MSSPFQTIEEFQGAIASPTEGATYAHAPSLIGIAIGLSAMIFCALVYTSFTTKAEKPSPSNPIAVSLVLMTGLTSLATMVYPPQNRVEPTFQSVRSPSIDSLHRTPQRAIPALITGLLGFVHLPKRGRFLRRSRQSIHRKRSLAHRSRPQR